MGKLRGYLKRLRHEYSMWTHGRAERWADLVCHRFLLQLANSPPHVLLGPNYAEFGGVKGHLQAIERYSSLTVELWPPDWLVKKIGLYRCQRRLTEQFSKFDSSSCLAIHSHVYPDFIQWCYQQQQDRKAFWVHTYHLNYYAEHGRGVLEKWQSDINDGLVNVAKHADYRLSVSKWQVGELREKYGIEAIYVPNGVDVAAGLQAKADRFHRRYNLDKFVLYVGRLDAVKNPDEFVRLASSLEDYPCVMIGGGLSPETLAAGSGQLPANLHILGSQPPSVVADALAAASVLVVTSLREGLPTLVLEGLIQGTPIVVPDEPGCLEAVANGRFAEVYRLGDVEELARKVRLLIERGRQDLGAVQYVRQFFDWKQVARHLDKIFLRERAGDFPG